ncbi:hypothetical protein PRIPAC_78137 [Pristionchus pacificus]|nr:hypothetical protein PRIPAC_78137 [Pristionchus pacificus]
MKFLPLLLSLIFILDAQTKVRVPNPFMDRMIKVISDWTTDNYESKDPLSKPKQERVEMWRVYRITTSCIYVYCHFEDRNSCRKEYENLPKQWNPAYNRTESDHFEDCKLSFIMNEKGCVNDCIAASFKTDQTSKLCSSLCATLFSYSEKEREEFRKQSVTFCYYDPIRFLLPWV